MKIFTNILIFLAVALIVFNITLLDFSNPFQGDSVVAFIGIVASFCAVLILWIFRVSKAIEQKTLGAIGMGDALFDQTDNDVVTN